MAHGHAMSRCGSVRRAIGRALRDLRIGVVIGGALALALLPPGGAHAQDLVTPGLVTCTSFFQRFAVVLVREGFVAYQKGTEGCGAPIAIDTLPDAERAGIGSLTNPVPPGPPFFGPVGFVPTVLPITTGPPTSFLVPPSAPLTPPGGPSTIGANIGVQQPAVQPATPIR